MKKLLKYFVFVFVIISLFSITGCDNKENNNNNENSNVKESVALKLVNEFKNIINEKSDLKDISESLSKSDTIKINVDILEVKEGLLDGFDNQIKGFNEGYVIKPMIGAQPFIMYVFKTDDVISLKDNLSNNANKRWNICTQADDLEIYFENNYVFLVMAPNNFED